MPRGVPKNKKDKAQVTKEVKSKRTYTKKTKNNDFPKITLDMIRNFYNKINQANELEEIEKVVKLFGMFDFDFKDLSQEDMNAVALFFRIQIFSVSGLEKFNQTRFLSSIFSRHQDRSIVAMTHGFLNK